MPGEGGCQLETAYPAYLVPQVAWRGSWPRTLEYINESPERKGVVCGVGLWYVAVRRDQRRVVGWFGADRETVWGIGAWRRLWLSLLLTEIGVSFKTPLTLNS